MGRFKTFCKLILISVLVGQCLLEIKKKSLLEHFALSSFEHRSPIHFIKNFLETGSSIVSIVLQNEDVEKRIKLFSNAMQNTADGMIITNEKNEIIEINGAIKDLWIYKRELIGKIQNFSFKNPMIMIL